jgi:DNA-3-methyladenine glycosylase I
MTKVIFRSGLNWEVIEKKWPDFRRAFANFSIRKVARFDEPDIDRLMKDPGIVRNYRKILATLENAKEFLNIRKDHGSFANYLKAMSRDGEEALCRALSKRFSFLGGSTVVFFLRAIGEEMPETLRRWEGKAALSEHRGT